MSEPRSEPHVFDLSGGEPCLDFANSVSDRAADEPAEHLRSYADLLAWARQAGLVDARRAAALHRGAAERPAAAERALAEALALREAIFRIFSRVAAGRRPPAVDLAALNRHLPRALGRLCVAPAGDGFDWRWDDDPEALDAVLWPVLRSAAELLTGGDLAAVRECAAANCRWLFLDASRNRSRRWCDMKVCGNREKVRRHYRRRKGGSGRRLG